ncbi:MAG: S8 family peptidase [Pseudomonadota bacterium]
MTSRSSGSALWSAHAFKRNVTAVAAVLLTGFSAAASAAPEQRLIIKYKPETSLSAAARVLPGAVTDIATRRGLRLDRLRTLAVGGDLLKLDRSIDPAELKALMAEVAADPRVEYVEEDRLLTHSLTPNDSRYSEQWSYYESTGGMNAAQAWDQTTGAGVVVAVLDTGYRPHADLAANIVGGYDFISTADIGNDGNGRDSDAKDPGDWIVANECGTGSAASNSSWHGTHVAGTIAAVTNNGSGVAGVAYGAKVVPLRVLGKCGGYTSDISDAIVWASGGTVSGVPANANPAKVINLSLGGSGACSTTTQGAINSARSRNATVVVAAGNENQNASNSNPANCTGVISVAAVNRSGGRAYYSNFGNVVDLAAPGGAQNSATDANGILSTLNAGTTVPGADSYAFFQGTSMATPHVAGAAALLYAVKPAITPDEVESTLKSTVRAFPATCSGCGVGIINANAAVTAAKGGGGGTGGTCPTGYTSYTGSFTASGQSLYAPNSSGARPVRNGSYLATMAGPAGTDFDLYLQRRSGTSGSWTQVAASEGSTSSESINYASGSTSYFYRWRAYSYSGTGAVTLCTKAP